MTDSGRGKADKNKAPWYIWLSFIALILLLCDTARRIKLSRKSFWGDFDLWLKACLNFMKITILYIIIPIIIYGILLNIVLRHTQFEQIAIDISVMLLLLLFVYLPSVYAVFQHVIWRRKNISHLLDKSLLFRRGLSALSGRIASIFQKDIDSDSNHN